MVAFLPYPIMSNIPSNDDKYMHDKMLHVDYVIAVSSHAMKNSLEGVSWSCEWLLYSFTTSSVHFVP